MTIFALSSGPGVSGIAVIRVSGKETSKVIQLLTGKDIPQPRIANPGERKIMTRGMRTVPKGSMCALGSSVTLPCKRGRGSPSLSATKA